MPDDALTLIDLQNQRLVAALDRMERLVKAAQVVASPQTKVAAGDAPAEDAPTADALLRENQRLRAANAELRASLQDLTDAAALPDGDDPAAAIERALRAEVEALRAERAAEVAELDSILAELRPLIAGGSDHARA